MEIGVCIVSNIVIWIVVVFYVYGVFVYIFNMVNFIGFEWV